MYHLVLNKNSTHGACCIAISGLTGTWLNIQNRWLPLHINGITDVMKQSNLQMQGYWKAHLCRHTSPPDCTTHSVFIRSIAQTAFLSGPSNSHRVLIAATEPSASWPNDSQATGSPPMFWFKHINIHTSIHRWIYVGKSIYNTFLPQN